MKMSGAYARIWEKLLAFVKKNKYVLLVLAAGLVLILWPGGKEDGEPVAAVSAEEQGVSFSLEKQEEKLTEILQKIDGAGQVEVMLTVRTSAERVVATEEERRASAAGGGEEETESTVTVVVVSSDRNETPVTIKYIYPEYQGAVVVAEGAGDAAVRLALTDAVSAVTGLSTDKITVVKMNQHEGGQK